MQVLGTIILKVLSELSIEEITSFFNLCQYNVSGGIFDVSPATAKVGYDFEFLETFFGISSQTIFTLQTANLIEKPVPNRINVFKKCPDGAILEFFNEYFEFTSDREHYLRYLPFTNAGIQLAALSDALPNEVYRKAIWDIFISDWGVQIRPLTTEECSTIIPQMPKKYNR